MEQHQQLIEQINSDLGTQCIQSAVIPPFIKDYFLSMHDLKDLQCLNPEMNNLYKSWLSETFFNNYNFSYYNTDITKRVQDADGTVYSSWHREFCNPNKKDNIGMPAKLYITSNTHIVFYYPLLNNCKDNCGTRIKYLSSDGSTVIITLPANNDIVYCLRDCCFAHISPKAIPEVLTEPITRVIVRSYITPEGESWETSKCPAFVSEWGTGVNKKTKRKNIKTKRKNKMRKTHKNKTHKNKTHKNKTHKNK